MKLIVGLGNIGKEYDKTRHNTGFLVIDKMAEKLQVNVNKTAFSSLTCKFIYKGEQVMLMKPTTYMNESGRAIIKAINYYHLNIEIDVLIIYDDLDLPYGKIRLRESGSAGGHNGIKSIIANVSSQKFCRIRVGIQKNPLIPVIDYVLGKVEKEKLKLYEDSIKKASEAAIEFINAPFQNVMNKYNKESNE